MKNLFQLPDARIYRIEHAASCGQPLQYCQKICGSAEILRCNATGPLQASCAAFQFLLTTSPSSENEWADAPIQPDIGTSVYP